MSTVLEDVVVAVPEAHDMYAARRSDLRLVIEPIYPRYADGGRKVGEVPGITVQFQDGHLKVPKHGTMAAADGRRVDAEVIRQALDSHRLLGDREGGFWKSEPAAPVPTAGELSLISTAAALLDEDRLAKLIADEEAGWARPQLLEVAVAARQTVLAALEAGSEEAAKAQAVADAAAAENADLKKQLAAVKKGQASS